MHENLEFPVYLFHQGTAQRAYELLGSHPWEKDGQQGYVFRLWAPHAIKVFLIGTFNDWKLSHSMKKINEQGIWEVFLPEISEGQCYKYSIFDSRGNRYDKADPYGFFMEKRPATASKIYSLGGYSWKDENWRQKPPYTIPINIYEVHLGSWCKEKDGSFLSYSNLAESLIPYVKHMGYTHIELMPISEHPFDASWGYQVTGYYAVSSRYGTPKEFMSFVDACHANNIGVILDWVPGHFPKDACGLYQLDGDSCYEYGDLWKREHKEWGTMVFDWGKNEVKSFLISNALFWLKEFHMDGLRVDAVASMLYLDYGRNSGEWWANQQGGRENLEAVRFLQELNTAVFQEHPNTLMVAEESTAWPMVTKPVEVGGLGFNFKWNMGWMNDTLSYLKTSAVQRTKMHHKMTFPMTYAFSENFILPLSHDEVVHMKGSLLGKTQGNAEEQLKILKTYYGYMMTQPGKKLLFMGGEFAQENEWHYESELDWSLLNSERHQRFQKYVRELNYFYQRNSELWELDYEERGFQWIEADDDPHNVYTYLRKNRKGSQILCICNFSVFPHKGYQLKRAQREKIRIMFCSEYERYNHNGGIKRTEIIKKGDFTNHGFSIFMDIPALSFIVLKVIKK